MSMPPNAPVSRRRLLLSGLALTAAAGLPRPSLGADPITATDLAGRTITLRAPARKVILGEGRLMYGFSTLVPRSPFERVVGWADDMIMFDPGTWRKYRAACPQAERLPRFSNAVNADFSTEQAISLDPDLVIFPLSAHQRLEATNTYDKLARAGIPTAVVDFREQPSQNTSPSIEVLGRLLGLDAEARGFNDYFLRETRRVSSRVWNLPANRRITVLMERAAGYDPNSCCQTFGNANLGVTLQEAGGINWGAGRFPGLGGNVNPETIFTDDPEVIIGTGADWSESVQGSRGVPFGYEATPERVQAAIRALAERPGWPSLRAVKTKRFYSIYHQFYTSPAHLVALQVFAKWLYPQQFADVDPDATWRVYHERFSPIPLTGVFWAQLA
ncbi:ABC transporter substrate-binding protein [Roseomonas terrae]|uniref:ABC transporter substrate-binding protein n=1 Tax=Neoroseomonas terrae TaxID=424799 RepID=A0ABS5EPA2_9PROT|nr:ABC transporter substrate-binding protein [Neoroseomonas terrae]MBR0652775.1 ABC transporter substrate-binding protein [Neoroseomonas terrae]